MISYCHKLDVCLCVSLLLVYPDETARPGPSEWRTFGMADRYQRDERYLISSRRRLMLMIEVAGQLSL